MGSYGQDFSPLGTTAGYNLAAVLGGHAATEAVRILTGSVMRLKGTFHVILSPIKHI